MRQQNKIFSDFKKLFPLYKKGAVFTAFDTETTGLYPNKDCVIEIGAVKFDQNEVIDTFDILINPGISIPYYITNINHISNEMVRSAPSYKEASDAFMDFIGDSILIAHNANFDLGFINSENERIAKKPLSNLTIDTLNLTRNTYPALGKYSLQFLAEYFAINVENAHRANDDARVCMEVFVKTIFDFEERRKAKLNPEELSQDRLEHRF